MALLFAVAGAGGFSVAARRFLLLCFRFWLANERATAAAVAGGGTRACGLRGAVGWEQKEHVLLKFYWLGFSQRVWQTLFLAFPCVGCFPPGARSADVGVRSGGGGGRFQRLWPVLGDAGVLAAFAAGGYASAAAGGAGEATSRTDGIEAARILFAADRCSSVASRSKTLIGEEAQGKGNLLARIMTVWSVLFP